MGWDGISLFGSGSYSSVVSYPSNRGDGGSLDGRSLPAREGRKKRRLRRMGAPGVREAVLQASRGFSSRYCLFSRD